jgi:hypothetical protein
MFAPTDAQISQVKANIEAMQALNDYVYDHSDAKVLNAFLLMSEKDDDDPGLAIGINLLEGVFAALGGFLGGVGALAATFLNGMISTWASQPPPELNTTFANMLNRLSETSRAADRQLATYYQDPVGNWDASYTYQGETATLSDLAEFQFPAETDPRFEDMAGVSLDGLDHAVWTTVLRTNYVITKFVPTPGYGQNEPQPFTIPGEPDAFPASLADAYLVQNPSYYLVPVGWLPKEGCGSEDRWVVQEYNVGTGVTGLSDGGLSRDACNYLFKNGYTDTAVNPAGLFERAYVFTSMGIPTTSTNTNVFVAPAAEVSTEYRQALVTGDTLGALASREGRASIEARIVARAHEDPVFARRLALQPRTTLQDFLGVRIPETLLLSVVVESEQLFGIVIPRKNLPVYPPAATPHDPAPGG